MLYVAPLAPQSLELDQKAVLSWNRPAIYKDPFSQEEDRIIENFVREHGPQNWNRVAAQLELRTPKQCRERWHNHLDPTIDRRAWTYEEDQVLVAKQALLGNRWADIAKFLPGRTDTLVKNRWTTWLRPRLSYDRQGNLTFTPDPDLYEKHAPAGSASKSHAPNREILAWLEQFATGGSPHPHATDLDWIPPLVSRHTV
jgi:hypothetical protein